MRIIAVIKPAKSQIRWLSARERVGSKLIWTIKTMTAAAQPSASGAHKGSRKLQHL